jgi:hypothetical protein
MAEPLSVGQRELEPDRVRAYVRPRERPFEGRRRPRPFRGPCQYRAS